MSKTAGTQRLYPLISLDIYLDIYITDTMTTEQSNLYNHVLVLTNLALTHQHIYTNIFMPGESVVEKKWCLVLEYGFLEYENRCPMSVIVLNNGWPKTTWSMI